MQDDLRPFYDPYTYKCTTLAVLADNTYATYLQRKGVGVIQERDFCCVTYIHEHKDNAGDISIVQFSNIAADSLVPEQPKVTRGIIHLQTWLL